MNIKMIIGWICMLGLISLGARSIPEKRDITIFVMLNGSVSGHYVKIYNNNTLIYDKLFEPLFPGSVGDVNVGQITIEEHGFTRLMFSVYHDKESIGKRQFLPIRLYNRALKNNSAVILRLTGLISSEEDMLPYMPTLEIHRYYKH